MKFITFIASFALRFCCSAIIWLLSRLMLAMKNCVSFSFSWVLPLQQYTHRQRPTFANRPCRSCGQYHIYLVQKPAKQLIRQAGPEYINSEIFPLHYPSWLGLFLSSPNKPSPLVRFFSNQCRRRPDWSTAWSAHRDNRV